MKRLLSYVMILIIMLFTISGCSGKDSESQNSQQSTPATSNTSAVSKSSGITNFNAIGVQITFRMDLSGTDAAVYQEYYKADDLTWNGNSFSGSGSYKKEIRYRNGNYDVNENVTISGKASSDGKTIESLKITNDRKFIDETTLVVDQSFEFIDIPLKDPESSDNDIYHRREDVDNVLEMLDKWLVKETNTDDETIETLLDQFTRHKQDLEIEILFFK